ncbi:MAG TPA: hypothetical protein VGK19_24975 [Capsulimonadaceae bacterium]|jgi:hypothetical protein
MDVIDICRMVARSLFAEIGPWGNRCALIGGITPGLLIPVPENPLQPHVGTRDVDLAIRVATISDEPEAYRTLRNNLTALGLAQTSDRSFEWKRNVEGIDIVVELFVPVDDPDEAGKIQRKPIEQSGSGLTALGIFGLNYIDRDTDEVEDEGPLLDGKGIKRVTLRVSGPAIFIGLKAWALKERNKPKDGYDVVWTLKAYSAEAVAARFRTAQLHQTDFGRQALDHLSDAFKTHEHSGPAGWVMESGFESGQAQREAREAAGIVQAFVRLTRV